MTKIVISTSRTPEVPIKTKTTRTKSKCCVLISYSFFPLLILLTAGIVLICVLFPSNKDDEEYFSVNNTQVHALLIAGSRGIHNYRHQADVALTYHLLLKKGVPRDNIVTMMFDDIAHHAENPHKGELRSSQFGPNLYRNLRIDYSGDDVNTKVLSAVLMGQKKEVATKGTSRVLDNSANRNVFIYYSDHGHGGVLGMPSGEFLTKRKLQNILSSIEFNALAIYIEACQAARMMIGYENSSKVSALVASTATESSYAANCRAGICYSDEFTLVWTNDTLKHDIRRHTLQRQYTNVKHYLEGSTAVSFGNRTLTLDWVQNYQGGPLSNANESNDHDVFELSETPKIKLSTLDESLMRENEVLSIPAIDVPIYSAEWKVKLAKTPEDKITAQADLDSIISGRKSAENLITNISNSINGTSSSNGVANEEDCYELILEEFSNKCFALGTNTYFTRIIPKLKHSISGDNCQAIIDIMTSMCLEVPRTNGPFIV